MICDAKSIPGFLSQELENIENVQKQNMVEELVPYNEEVLYIPGKKMEFPENGSMDQYTQSPMDMDMDSTSSLTQKLAVLGSACALGGSNWLM